MTQLELFQVLTVEQEDRINIRVREKAEHELRRFECNKDNKELLIKAGFVDGVDFIDSVKLSSQRCKFWIGGFKNDYIEEMVDVCVGDLDIISNIHDERDNIIVQQKCYTSWDNGKVNCMLLQDYNGRFLKPSTMLAKLKNSTRNALLSLEIALEKNNILDYTFDKYTELYPKARVYVEEVYIDRSSRAYDKKMMQMILVEFNSGSSVTLRLGRKKDDEILFKSVDNKTLKMGMIDKLNYFNNQI
jgi:hypothetical protein